MKTASTNSPWAYIWEGLSSEGFLRLRFGRLILGRAYFFGGAYYRNFTVYGSLVSPEKGENDQGFEAVGSFPRHGSKSSL